MFHISCVSPLYFPQGWVSRANPGNVSWKRDSFLSVALQLLGVWTSCVNHLTRNLYLQIISLFLCDMRIPANILIVCNDKKQKKITATFWSHICLGRPTCRDSKPMSYAPTDVPANVPHSKASPIAAHIRFLTTSLSQLQMRNLEPKYFNCKKYRAIPTTNL